MFPVVYPRGGLEPFVPAHGSWAVRCRLGAWHLIGKFSRVGFAMNFLWCSDASLRSRYSRVKMQNLDDFLPVLWQFFFLRTHFCQSILQLLWRLKLLSEAFSISDSVQWSIATACTVQSQTLVYGQCMGYLIICARLRSLDVGMLIPFLGRPVVENQFSILVAFMEI